MKKRDFRSQNRRRDRKSRGRTGAKRNHKISKDTTKNIEEKKKAWEVVLK